MNKEEEMDKDLPTEEMDKDSIIKAKDEEIGELTNSLVRLQADFINFRKRAEKEKENSISYGIESFVCELLPIIDNFQRALQSENNKEDKFYQGISMIEQQLINLLNNNSVAEIPSLGEQFDPNYHHAVFMEDSDSHEPGIVIDVMQKGYKLKEKVIRPSMVKVTK